MKATGVVIRVESGREEKDRVERVTIKVLEAESFGYNRLCFPNVDGLKIDDEVTVDICLTVPTKIMNNSLDIASAKA